MASVQMSQTLRDHITTNYKKALYKTLAEVNNITSAIDSIVKHFKSDKNFQKLLDLNETYIPLAETLEQKYPSVSQYRSNFSKEILELQNEMGIICNPKRPISDNFTFVKNWSYPYEMTDYNGVVEKQEGKNFCNGDIGVSIKNIDFFYFPMQTSLSYNNWRTTTYSPYADSAVIITDPKLCEQLSPIGSIEVEVGKKSETFNEWLKTITTLKKFLDEVPSGLDFVPDEYKERLQRKTKPKKKSIAPPLDIMPDSLKNTFNEVILENKLLGDK